MNGYNNIKAICFDYYGTLVDVGKPFYTIREWFHKSLQKQKLSISSNRFCNYFNKRRAKYTYQVSKFYTGREILITAYMDACEKYKVQADYNGFEYLLKTLFILPEAFHDVSKSLVLLRKKYLIGLVTNADNEFLYQSVNRQGFHFDFIKTSENAKCNKPNLKIFEEAVIKTNFKKHEILMIGDSIAEDILPAKELGINSILINREGKKSVEDIEEISGMEELLHLVD